MFYVINKNKKLLFALSIKLNSIEICVNEKKTISFSCLLFPEIYLLYIINSLYKIDKNKIEMIFNNSLHLYKITFETILFL